MFINEECGKCGCKIPMFELRLEPNFWDCPNPQCGNRNYKHISQGWLCVGDSRREGIPKKEDIQKEFIIKDCIDTIGNQNIFYRENNGLSHEVLDKDGNVIHSRHKL